MESELTERIARAARELECQNEQWTLAMTILSRGGQGMLAVPRDVLQTLDDLSRETTTTIVGVLA